MSSSTTRPDDRSSAMLSRPSPDGWVDVASAQFLAEVSAAAKGLIAAGVQPGDRIGLLSKTRYEWTLFDFAIWFSGAVHGPDLRDVVGRTGPVDHDRLRGGGRDRRDLGP